MSVRQFLNSRAGFVGLATLLCGASFFLGIGLKEDARLRAERQVVLEKVIEQRVEQRLKKEQENDNASLNN